MKKMCLRSKFSLIKIQSAAFAFLIFIGGEAFASVKTESDSETHGSSDKACSLCLIWPKNGARVTSNSPILKWSRYNGALAYKIFINDKKMATVKGNINSYIPFPLSEGVHQWYVVAKFQDKSIKSSVSSLEVLPSPLETLPENSIRLGKGWEMQSSYFIDDSGKRISRSSYDTEGWYPTSVPATALSVLVRAGEYPNPYVGKNNMLIPDASDEFNSKHDLLKFSHIPGENPWSTPYWYRKEFVLDRSLEPKRLKLHFNEINYRAEVWLNGKRLSDQESMVGMEHRFEYDITKLAKFDKSNVLAVAIYPLDNVGLPAEPPLKAFQDPGRNLGGDSKITLDYTKWDSLGWDWLPAIRDRNIGITEDVFISVSSDIEINDVYVAADLPLPRTDYADIFVSAMVKNHSSKVVEGRLVGSIVSDNKEELHFEQALQLSAKQEFKLTLGGSDKYNEERHTHWPSALKNYRKLRITNPLLWWPRGYGEQNLYRLNLSYIVDGKVLHRQSVKFGVRELNSYFGNNEREYQLNGKKIYIRGGNWVNDMMLTWNGERLAQEVELAARSNLNLLRVWGPTGVPARGFYEKADELGIMIWQDFLHDHWGTYNNHPDYHPEQSLYQSASIDIVKKLRNHASLLIWSGGNEGINPRQDWIMEELLPSYDPKGGREYLKESNGDGLHGGGPYHTLRPKEYFEHPLMHGFSSEIGPSGVPVFSSMQRFLENLGTQWKEGRFPVGDEWAYHDFNDRDEEGDMREFSLYDNIIREDYGAPEDKGMSGVKDYALKAQLVNYNAYRAAIEAINKQLWKNSSGFVLWKFNSAWPSLTWQLFDWYQIPHAGFYAVRNASSQIHAQINADDNRIVVINSSPETLSSYKLVVEKFDSNSKLLWQKKESISLEAGEVYRSKWSVPESQNGVSFLSAKLWSGNELKSNNFYWREKNNDFTEVFNLPTAKLVVTPKALGDDSLLVEVKNTTNVIAFFVELNLVLADDSGLAVHDIIPMQSWEDNYFSLKPYETRTLRVEVPGGYKDHEIIYRGINLPESSVGF